MKRTLTVLLYIAFLITPTLKAQAGAIYYESDFSFSEDNHPVETVGPYKEKKPETVQTEEKAKKPEKEIDHQPVVDMETGKVSDYKPPEVVSTFVGNPSTENAIKYLDWIDAQTKKVQVAGEVLQKVAKEREERKRAEKRQEEISKQSDYDKPIIVGFITPDCPHCVKQAIIYNDLLRYGGLLGKVDIQIIMPTDEVTKNIFVYEKKLAYRAVVDQGESQKLEIQMWPTTLVFRKDSLVPIKFEGVVMPDDLKKAMFGNSTQK